MLYVDGYIADSLYPSMYHHRFAPAWIDSFLVRGRVQPPRQPRGAFTLVDAGCGDGYGLIVNAVAYPEAHCIGFDASAEHIDRGTALVRELGLNNIELHCATLQDASFSAPADYITAQGLLSWISRSNQEALWGFVQRTLRPGGVFVVGYNTLPGWSEKIPFQRLVRAFADELPGNSSERFVAAFYLASATELVPEHILERIEETLAGKWGGYMAHEYLNRHWEPLWSGDVIEMANAHGLSFVRTLMEQWVRPDLSYTKAQRETLARIGNERAREIAADMFRNSSFRTDVFVQPPTQQLSPVECEGARLQQVWWLHRGADDVVYSCRTAGGTLRFNNRYARAIVAKLAEGPARLAEVSGASATNLLNAADMLFTAGIIRPAELPGVVPVAAEWNRRVLSGELGVSVLVGECGAAGFPGDVGAVDAVALRRMGVSSAGP